MGGLLFVVLLLLLLGCLPRWPLQDPARDPFATPCTPVGRHGKCIAVHSMRPIAIVLLGICLLPACSNVLTRRAPQPSTPQAEGSVLAMRVNHALMSAQVEGYAELRITAVEGDVVMEGALATQARIEQVVDVVRKVEGVKTATYRAVAPR